MSCYASGSSLQYQFFFFSRTTGHNHQTQVYPSIPTRANNNFSHRNPLNPIRRRRYIIYRTLTQTAQEGTNEASQIRHSPRSI